MPDVIINNDYKIGLKREVITALKPLFGNTFPYEDLRNRVYVGLEYPMKQVQYPGIYVTFREEMLQNGGISHIEYDYTDSDIFPKLVKHWIFQGTLHFNILALTPLDRDRLSAAMVNILAFSEVMPDFTSFWTEIRDADYVAIQPITDKIYTGGEQIGGVPWDSEDELQYGASYSIPVFGEFWSIPQTGELIQISQVDAYPYREQEQDPPW